MHWHTINNSRQISGIIESSYNRPQIIFKHSTTCPISSIAKRRLDSNIGDLEIADLYYLDLLSYRSVSNDIAEQLGVHHESPQVIVIHKGETSYEESHLDISVEDLLEHFKYLQN